MINRYKYFLMNCKCKNESEKIADHISKMVSFVQRLKDEHGTKKSYYHRKNLIKFKNKI